MNFFFRGAWLFAMLMKVLVRKLQFSFGSSVFRLKSYFLTSFRKLASLNFFVVSVVNNLWLYSVVTRFKKSTYEFVTVAKASFDNAYF